jgi:hypothetical protein
VKEILGNRFFEGMDLGGELQKLVACLDRLRDIVVGTTRITVIIVPVGEPLVSLS